MGIINRKEVNMKKVQYVGDSHYREITASDWKSLEVENGPGKLVWDRDNRGGDGVHARGKSLARAHELEDDVATALVEAMPTEFKVVDEPKDLGDVGAGPDAPAVVPEGGGISTPTGGTSTGRPGSTSTT